MSVFFYARIVRKCAGQISGECFRAGHLVCGKRRRGKMGWVFGRGGEMPHVCRTWRTRDNASEIGAVIDITGRRGYALSRFVL